MSINNNPTCNKLQIFNVEEKIQEQSDKMYTHLRMEANGIHIRIFAYNLVGTERENFF